MTEEKKHKKRHFLFNPLKRPLPYLGLVIALVLVIFQQTIRNYVSDSIGEILVNSMQEATGGVYKTTYDVVRFDFISSELRISNLQIELDSNVITKERYLRSKPNLIHVNTPIIVVKLKSIFPLIFSNKLYVSYVGAQTPEFSLIKSEHSSVPENAAESSKEDIRETIRNYFSALEIDSFRIETGIFTVGSHLENEKEFDVLKVKEFSMLLKNFRLDSLSPSILLKGIRAQSLELEVSDQDINLPNLNQSIHFDKLTLSTTDSTVVLDSLIINTIDKNKGNASSSMQIGNLELQGVNFDEAFQNNNVSINKINITNPNLFYHQLKFNVKSGTTQSTKNTLFSSFNKVNVNSIRVFNGKLNLEAKHKTKIENFSLGISDYAINREDWKKRKLISDLNLLFFKANHIQQDLPDSIHTTTIQSVVYNPAANKFKLSNISITPIKGRNTYRFLKSKNTNNYTSTQIKEMSISGLDVPKLIATSTLSIDSIRVSSPKALLVQYPGMHLKSKPAKTSTKKGFSINHFALKNGTVRVKAYQNKTVQQYSFSNISLKTSTITALTTLKKLPSSYTVAVENSSIELKQLGHTLKVKQLKFNQLNHLNVGEISIAPDSSTLPFHHFTGQLKNVGLTNIKLKALLNSSSILADTLSIGEASFLADLTRKDFKKIDKNNSKGIQNISINKVVLSSGNGQLLQGNNIFKLSGYALGLDSLSIDSLTTNHPKSNFSNSEVLINAFSLNNKKTGTKISGQRAAYSEQEAKINIHDFTFINADKKQHAGARLVAVTGFNKNEFYNNKSIIAHKIQLVAPHFALLDTLASQSNKPIDATKKLLSEGINIISFDSLELSNGNGKVALPKQKTFGIKLFEGKITNYKIDTTTTIFDAASNLKGVFELNNIYLNGPKDTIAVKKVHFDTYQRFAWTDSIKVKLSLPSNILKIASPGIGVDYIDIPDLLKQKISISRISTRNNMVHLFQTDTTSVSKRHSLKTFKLPVDLFVGNLNINHTKFTYTKIKEPNHILSKLNFDIEADSIWGKKEVKFDLLQHISDIKLNVYRFSFNLPDSLNTLGFDSLQVSSKKSEMKLSNVTLQARYPKYEYGKHVGHQVDWKDLLLKTIEIKKIDFKELVEKNTLMCNKISLANGHLKLFKDKQLPFPTDRRVPILQDRIRAIKTPIKIDSIEIKGLDIYQTTLQSTGKTEGSISFRNTNGLITNITNDSTRLKNNRLINVTATSKIMNSGDLYAEFEFDMLDPNRLFFFDARLGPMQANAYNNILEATAFVKVKSGDIKSINLHATGNKSYAYGDMSFIYSNLKVETINKKTLENKGMGKVLKTFFANAFVVKKNNSRLKLLARRGGMYYERDPSRITLDYMAKTALSGVVSSIGAKSNRKQIKQIQKENKAARDLELKQQKEAEKAAKKKARKG